MRGQRIGKLNLHKASLCWYVRIDGHMRYITSKGASEEQAQLALARIRLEMACPVNATKTTDDETVSNLFRLHLEKVKDATSQKNYNDKRRILESFISVHGEKPYGDVTPLMVQDWLRTLPVRTTGGGQRNAYAHVASACNWCVNMLRATNRPHRGFPRPQDSVRGEEYVFSVDEYRNVLELTPQPYQSVLAVLWLTGARPSEIIDADVSEYHPAQHCLHKRFHKTSNKGKQRVILLPPDAERIIREFCGERNEGRIFQTAVGKPLCERWANESFVANAVKCGRTKPACLYSLRHSFAVRQLEAMSPINIVAGWLGNTVTVCEKHYAHTIARLSQTIGRIV